MKVHGVKRATIGSADAAGAAFAGGIKVAVLATQQCLLDPRLRATEAHCQGSGRGAHRLSRLCSSCVTSG
ncbi:hypothetical protein WJX73_000106 [Symbiochloris irregularis]|uniref:Uncharacterized protein n=1 Tax=Symbiochloris irregularis TaxID=706552 RepID=A0AAW1PCP1_9CHLO